MWPCDIASTLLGKRREEFEGEMRTELKNAAARRPTWGQAGGKQGCHGRGLSCVTTDVFQTGTHLSLRTPNIDSPVVECLPSKSKTRGSIPRTAKHWKKEEKKKSWITFILRVGKSLRCVKQIWFIYQGTILMTVLRGKGPFEEEQ